MAPQAAAPAGYQAPTQQANSAWSPEPAAATAPSQEAQGWGSYTLQHGDTIWDLAVRKGEVSLDEFKKYNPEVDFDNYKAGQTIQLPPSAAASLEDWKPGNPASPAPSGGASNPTGTRLGMGIVAAATSARTQGPTRTETTARLPRRVLLESARA